MVIARLLLFVETYESRSTIDAYISILLTQMASTEATTSTSKDKKAKKVLAVPNKNTSKNTKNNDETAKTKQNIVLLCILMLGIGCISGYFVFIALHTSRCAELMDVEEQRYSKSQEQLKDRYLQTVEEHQSCLTELKGSDGNKHGIRFEKHQALMDRHQETVDQLLKLQSDHSDNLMQHQKLETELERSQETIEKLQGDKRKCLKSKELMKQLVTECKTKEKEL